MKSCWKRTGWREGVILKLSVFTKTYIWRKIQSSSKRHATSTRLGYNIQISRNNTFTQLVGSITLNGVTNSAYPPPRNLTANANLFWRVRAKLTITTYTEWSEVRTFQTANPPGVPILASPMNNALVTTTTPLFNWNNSTLPGGTTFDKYQIQVSTSNTFGATVIDAFTTLADITDSDYTPCPGILTNGTTYYWRVRSFNAAGYYSAWSIARYFREAMSPPALVAPIGGITVGGLKPLLDWDLVLGQPVTPFRCPPTIFSPPCE